MQCLFAFVWAKVLTLARIGFRRVTVFGHAQTNAQMQLEHGLCLKLANNN